jgi:hypothetical protein
LDHHFSPPARAWRWPGAIVSPAAASASSGRKMLNKCHRKKWCFPDFEGKMVLSRFRKEFHGILNGFVHGILNGAFHGIVHGFESNFMGLFMGFGSWDFVGQVVGFHQPKC